MDLAADTGCDLLDLCHALGQEIGKRWVGVLAVVVVLKRLEGREPDIMLPSACLHYYAAERNSPRRLVIPDGKVIRVRRLSMLGVSFQLPLGMEVFLGAPDVLVRALVQAVFFELPDDVLHGRTFHKSGGHFYLVVKVLEK